MIVEVPGTVGYGSGNAHLTGCVCIEQYTGMNIERYLIHYRVKGVHVLTF